MSRPSEAALCGILYVSGAVAEFKSDALDGLVRRAAEKNLRLGVTGILCFKHRQFLQYLEGPVEETRDLMRQIAADDRHRVLHQIDQSPIEARRFSTWSMRLIDAEYQQNITMEDLVFDTALAEPVDEQDAKWRFDLAWRVVDKIAAFHAKQTRGA